MEHVCRKERRMVFHDRERGRRFLREQRRNLRCRIARGVRARERPRLSMREDEVGCEVARLLGERGGASLVTHDGLDLAEREADPGARVPR